MEFNAVSLYFSHAIAKLLEEQGTALVTEYTLYLKVRPLLDEPSLGGEKVIRVPSIWARSHVRAMIRTLEKRLVLAPDDDFNAGVWRVVQAATAPPADEAICLVDPFAYVSHLSAMQRYGLTDRSPEALHMTTPARALWTALRDVKMSEDFSCEPHPSTLPQLMRIGLKPEVRRRQVVLHETRHPAKPEPIAGTASRIAPLGRVFVDMLDQADLCGGIHHVLDVFHRYAEDNMDEIINAVEAFDSPILKVRAGYILDELLGVSNPAVEKWMACAQRGGSRKLDPKSPYGSRFSEKWMIALNV
ncbi:type IV toxin-antitoxin system AbiEi family antitoxin domain-containing protein [Sphingomonas edaphi]|uniref:AbiEi antitoxin C-terminal domain-containing protein n=1 Tax=Sphingomonas edaphi TaxID=2315689 RepID=A0A418Q1F3_9SPHN|nr:hypothetical protein [Sphingomonas edaphi]RIX31856.1 hypothetical protein D3M59_02335 [Sphingomonas edaphi]